MHECPHTHIPILHLLCKTPLKESWFLWSRHILWDQEGSSFYKGRWLYWAVCKKKKHTNRQRKRKQRVLLLINLWQCKFRQQQLNISVSFTWFSSKIQNTAPCQFLGRKFTQSQLKLGYILIQSTIQLMSSLGSLPISTLSRLLSFFYYSLNNSPFILLMNHCPAATALFFASFWRRKSFSGKYQLQMKFCLR